MDIQRIRNLTSERLHTDIGCVYKDIEWITGAKGIMTHMLSNACRAMFPWLKEKVTDPRFWDGKYDKEHVGEYDLQPMTNAEQAAFWERYVKLESPLEGKEVIVVNR